MNKATIAAVAAFKARHNVRPIGILNLGRQQWTIRYARSMSAVDQIAEHDLALEFTRWWLTQDVRSFQTEQEAAQALAKCPQHLQGRARVEPLQSFGRL